MKYNKKIITQEEFDELYSNDILKSKYDEIISKIDLRFSEIAEHMFPNVLKHHNWYAYGNVGEEEEATGFFDPVEYKKEVEIGGEFRDPNLTYLEEAFFPTRWLWEPEWYQEFSERIEELKKEIEEEKEKKKNRNQFLKQKKQELIKSAKIKLSEEEKWAIGLSKKMPKSLK